MKSPVSTLGFLLLALSLSAQSGNVGIGITNPNNRLDIRDDGVANTPTIILGLASNVSNRPVLQFSEDAVVNPTSGMSIEYNGQGTGNNNKLHIRGTDELPKFTIMNNGYTGIGTASSDRELLINDISDNGDAIIELETSVGGTKGMILGLNQSTGGLLGTTTNTNMTFRTNNSTRLTITNSGEVGVGTTSTLSLLTLRGPDDSSTGPILTLYGNGTNQAESGRIRFLEFTSATNWAGGYIRYDGSANRFHIGVHDSGDNIPANDNDAISINRSTGHVGIGTPNPSEKLHVFGGDMIIDRGSATDNLTRVLRIEGARSDCCSPFARIDFRNIDADNGNVEYVGARITSWNGYGDDSGYLSFYTATSENTLNHRFEISANPNIGALLYSNVQAEGDIWPLVDDLYDLGSSGQRWDDVWATNAFIQTSDSREKTAVRELDYGLEQVMALKPVRFRWKKDYGAGEKLGLIAQEVLTQIPEVVVTNNTVIDHLTGEQRIEEVERLGMRYADLIPVLINAIQDQQALIEEQKNDIEMLKEKLDQVMVTRQLNR